MSGGAGYVFNYEALTRVSSIMKTKQFGENNLKRYDNSDGGCNAQGEYGIEDVELGKLLRN